MRWHQTFFYSTAMTLIVALAGAAWAQQQQDQQWQQRQQEQQWQQRQDQQWQQDQRADGERQPRFRDEFEGRWLRDPDLRRPVEQVREGDAPHVVSGEIMQVREARQMGRQHLHVGIITFDDQRVLIDIGPAQQAREIRDLLEPGERITVRGNQQLIDGQRVFVADHVRVAGERFSLRDWDDSARPARDVRDPQWRDERDRLERDRDRFERDRFDRDFEYREDRVRTDRTLDRTISGRVTGMREAQHMDERHLYLTIETLDGEHRTVDLGPVQQARQVRDQIQRGERIAVTGRQTMLDGQQVFAVNQVFIAGDRIDLDDWAQQARWREQEQWRDDRARTDWQRDRQQFDRQQQFDRDVDRQQQIGQRDRTPEGYVLVSERIIVLMTDQLNRHMTNARHQLQQQNAERAAAEVKLAAEFLEMYAGIAEGDVQTRLESSKQSLRQIADRIEQGEVTEQNELDREFVQAHRALAEYNLKEARNLREQDRKVAAGYRLQAASRHLQQAAAFAEAEVDQDTTRALQEAQQASARLIRGEAVENEDEMIQKLERQLERLEDEYN